MADLEGVARSALNGTAAALSAAAFTAPFLVFSSAAAFFAAFFAAILARYLSACSSATFAAHFAAVSLLLRKVFGTWKVPNLLCRAKTPWSYRERRGCRQVSGLGEGGGLNDVANAVGQGWFWTCRPWLPRCRRAGAIFSWSLTLVCGTSGRHVKAGKVDSLRGQAA